jgi:hypothetical protein
MQLNLAQHFDKVLTTRHTLMGYSRGSGSNGSSAACPALDSIKYSDAAARLLAAHSASGIVT